MTQMTLPPLLEDLGLIPRVVAHSYLKLQLQGHLMPSLGLSRHRVRKCCRDRNTYKRYTYIK